MEPSESLEQPPLTDVCRVASLCVKQAVGAWLPPPPPHRLATSRSARTRPWPNVLSKPAAPRSSAVDFSAATAWEFVVDGAQESASARTPATCGVAMLVPLIVPYEVVEE